MIDLEELRQVYTEEQMDYQNLADHVAQTLRERVGNAGLACSVTSRAKEVGSLLKKAVRKGYKDFSEIRDKAGIRVIATYHPVLSKVEDIIRETFEVLDYQDKGIGLPIDKIGYLGVHIEIGLREDQIAENLAFQGKVCEIQLLTKAQGLWAEVSHELVYKSPVSPSPQIGRMVHRLAALMEIFDYEIELARQAIRDEPGFEEARLLDALESHYLKFTTRPYDSELSAKILKTIDELLPAGERFPESMRAFVQDNTAKLQAIFEEYSDTERHPFLFQPEAIAVFERLEADPFILRERWEQELPGQILESLATVWGQPYDLAH